MLWTVRHFWLSGAKFTFNCYKHYSTLIIISSKIEDMASISSEEGVTQGDVLAMIPYGLALLTIIK